MGKTLLSVVAVDDKVLEDFSITLSFDDESDDYNRLHGIRRYIPDPTLLTQPM